jgi:AraC family transcriptional regulator of adaptative response/methylated-DNA-[protein]-cysteine methyltransferase
MEDIVMNAIISRPDAPAEDLRFAFGTSLLGTVLVAASHKGIVAILIGSDRRTLQRDLADAFPQARLTDDDGLEGRLAQVVAFLGAPWKGLKLPLDIRGSSLERAVWQALRDVPAGGTTTYGKIAKALPLPATAQDVGAACAANVLAVAIPCHRVVKADGSISGYRWGVQRKRKLINLEAVA